MTVIKALALSLALLAALVAGPMTQPAQSAQSASDQASGVTFRDPRGDVRLGHDIHRVRVDNGVRAVTITVWHRELRSSHQYSFRLYVDTDPSTSTPEVKVYGAFPNADYVACTTTSWSTGARAGCMPEDPSVQCRVDMRVRWLEDRTVFRLVRTATCLTQPGAVRANVAVEQYWPKDTRWDFAPDRRVWSRTVPFTGA